MSDPICEYAPRKKEARRTLLCAAVLGADEAGCVVMVEIKEMLSPKGESAMVAAQICSQEIGWKWWQLSRLAWEEKDRFSERKEVGRFCPERKDPKGPKEKLLSSDRLGIVVRSLRIVCRPMTPS